MRQGRQNKYVKTLKSKQRQTLRRNMQRREMDALKENEWIATKKHFGFACAYCGREKFLHRDHFVPLALGGKFTRTNIVPACRDCGLAKGNKDPRVCLPTEKYKSISEYLRSLETL